MPDNKSKTGKSDRSKVARSQDHEVDYLRIETGMSEADIKKAMKKVGNDRAKVIKELQKQVGAILHD